MARILYGVSGEGSGHSSRARVVANYLRAQGHELLLASYDRGLLNLKEDFDVLPIGGLTIGVSDGQVSPWRTLLENAARVPEGLRGLRRLRRAYRELRPELVLTDFEPCCAYLALRYDLPLVSVDNQHRMRYMELPIPVELERAARQTRAIIRAMVPRPAACVATTFYTGRIRDERLIPVPPILRDEVRAAPISDKGQVLVYATKVFPSLLEELGKLPHESFVVYGIDGGAALRQVAPANVRLREASRGGFLADLASCHAVVATAGFTLLTECLHLGKPLYALPLAGQFEQELNALLLEVSGCGQDGRQRGVAGIGSFLKDLDRFRGPLAAYDSGAPGRLFEGIERAMDLARRGRS